MSILEEKIAFITERIKEMAKKEAHENAYTFGVYQGLLYAKDILDDKACEDSPQLKGSEQLA